MRIDLTRADRHETEDTINDTHTHTHIQAQPPKQEQPKLPDSILNVGNDVGPLLKGRQRGGGWVKDSPRGVPLGATFNFAHQNRTIAIASDFHVYGVKSPEFPHRKKSQCSIVSNIAAIWNSWVRDGHRDRKSQESLRFRRAKHLNGGLLGAFNKGWPNHDHNHFWAHLGAPRFSSLERPWRSHQMPLSWNNRKGRTVTGGTGLDTYQRRFDTYQIPFLIEKMQRKTPKTCTEHSIVLDARART